MNLALVALLSDGGFHSGQALGEHLNISRAAIWKQIEVLQQLGLVIESHRGKGYRWVNCSALLSEDQVASSLPEGVSSNIELSIVESVESTNSYALNAASQGCVSGYVVAAEYQHAGRGRRGRQWVSPLAQNLFVTQVYRTSYGARALQGLSLVVGISLVSTLNSMFDLSCQLKWPNDVWLDGEKLGGILIELSGDVSGDCAAIIGWGLNVNQMPVAKVDAIDQAWTSLMLRLGKPIDRNKLLANLLAGFCVDLERFTQHGFSDFVARWDSVDGLQGRNVNVLVGNRSVFGEVQGIDKEGALVLKTEAGLETFHGGEVSVRPAV